MRVISGTVRGRNLQTPKSMRVRPTADRVKEAMFNILASRIGDFTDLRVLDLCAGTGNLGIEALSRGAGYALFVDNHRESAEIIRKNLDLTRLAGRARLLVQDAALALKLIERSEGPFHLIFLDPPYHLGLTQKLLEILSHSPLIDAGTVVVTEFSVKEPIPAGFGSLQEVDRRNYGDTAISILQISDRGEQQCP